MSRNFKAVLVGVVLGIEILAYGCWLPYPHGEMVDVAYRHKERLVAWTENRRQPSPATQARFDEELRLMHQHEDWKRYVNLAIVVIANGVGIYYFMNDDKGKTPSPKSI